MHLDHGLDQRQPQPEAAPAAIEVVSACTNGSNSRGSISGLDADPGVCDAHDRLPRGRRSSSTEMVPPWGELGGVVQQVADDLGQPGPSASTQSGRCAAELELQPRFEERSGGPRPCCDQLAEIEPLALQLDLAAGDAA